MSPLQNSQDEISAAILDLVQVVFRLRGPGGCPWDIEQTHQSLAPYALEETCELLEALDSADYPLMREELGDVLFQVALHCELSREAGQFTLAEVARDISTKLVRRHPHVFGDVKVNGSADVLTNWEIIKKKEKESKGLPQKPGFNIPPHLPALSKSAKIGHKTNKSGFDWSTPLEVLEKVDEEIQEMKDALKSRDIHHLEHEIGDVLFSVSQFARHCGLDAEASLRKANGRFELRYFKMIELCENDGLDWQQVSLEQKEEYWKRAKAELSESEKS
jgi:tetrapyrrole methylase family protein / MazG family protein